MSSQAAMLKPVLWERLFERESAPISACRARVRQMLVSAILSGHLPPGAPVPSSRHLADHLRIARNRCSLTSSWSARAIWCRASAAAIRQRFGHAGASAKPAQAMARPPQQRRPMTRSARALGSGCCFTLVATQYRQAARLAETALTPSSMASSTKTCFPPPNGASAVSRRCRCWTSAAGRRTSSPTTTRADRADPHPGAAAPGRLGRRVRDRHHRVRSTRSTCWPTCWSTTTRWSAWKTPAIPTRAISSPATRHLLPLPVDEHGLITGTQLLGCDYLFVTPGHQCPTSVTLSRERRDSLLTLASQADSMIIEDDFESESRWGAEPVPALKSLDREGRVIYVGSLAKSFAPGLRIGYIVAPPELAVELRALRRLMLRHPSAYIQRAFSLFISLGHHHSLLRRQSQEYQTRRRAGARAGAPPAGLPRRAHHRILVLLAGGSALARRRRAGRGRAGRWRGDRAGQGVLHG